MMIKHRLIEKARTSVVVCDRAKFKRLMPYTFARFEDVDYLISDDAVPQNVADCLMAAGVKVL